MNHRLAYVMLGMLAAAVLLPTAAQAQFGAGAQTSVADCRAFTTSSTVAVVDAGSIVFCSRAESRVSTSAAGWRLGASLTTPRLSGTSPSLTITLNALSGCTAGTPVVTGTAAGATFGAQASSSWMMTMTAGQCSGYLRGIVTSGGTTVYDGVLDFGVMSADTPNYNVNSGGITVTDDANGWSQNIASWPDLNVNQEEGYSVNGVRWLNGPTVINIKTSQASVATGVTDYLVASPAASVTGVTAGNVFTTPVGGGTCTSGTVAFSNSGVTSYGWTSTFLVPLTFTGDGCIVRYSIFATTTGGSSVGLGNFVHAVSREGALTTQQVSAALSGGITNTVSGGLTVTDDANGWALTGTLTIHQDPLSGTITVTNAGGQTMTVSSWPALNAVLSGSTTVDIADDTTDDGMLTMPVPTDTSFNSTFGNVTFQQATAKEKATAGYNAWAPLILALGILAASVLGARGINYTGVGFAGIMFMFAGIVSWKFTGNWPLGTVLIGFGLYLVILAGGELRSWRASKAEEAANLAGEASPE